MLEGASLESLSFGKNTPLNTAFYRLSHFEYPYQLQSWLSVWRPNEGIAGLFARAEQKREVEMDTALQRHSQTKREFKVGCESTL